jgi:hypothetical protein
LHRVDRAAATGLLSMSGCNEGFSPQTRKILKKILFLLRDLTLLE